MLELKQLIETGIKDGKDSKKMLQIISNNFNGFNVPIELFEDLYKEVYGCHLSDFLCEKMVHSMTHNGIKGEKWSIEQTNDVARKVGISFSTSDNDYSCYEFWATMHMMYYDYGHILEEQGINADAILFAKLADAYLDDEDSYPGKLVNYFFFLEKNRKN